jgi:hypothetical protein
VIPGVSGRLVSASFASTLLPDLSGIREAPREVHRMLLRWDAARQASLGTASSVRAVADVAIVPLLRALGFRIGRRRETPSRCEILADASSGVVPVLVIPWGESLDTAWRDTILSGIAADARWCLCSNGRVLRLLDAHRTWARQHQEFDLESVVHVAEALTLLWTLLRAEAVIGPEPLLDRAVAASTRHGIDICRSLADGVVDALGLVMRSLTASESSRRGTRLHALLDESLTVLYRILFLLFAEARGLVPVWHPVYRDRYTIDAIVLSLLAGHRCRGVWAALQAISRLAHAGCRAGDLRVTAFNGRLFSPLHTPLATRARVDDETIGNALLAMSTTTNTGRSGRTRIVYRDLDVEQLGAVYEHVLDYEADRDRSDVVLRRTGDVRKASGTFYTPRPVAGCLLRRTLEPLVRNRTAAEILNLRLLDPAMGSGAFLVAACRYLAAAAEAALVRDGELHAADVTADDRVALRRDVAQRCLFGVDLNPMAVQLARLSLWLATLAADKPLTFLDHRLVAGDSLAGASFEQVALRAPGGRGARRHAMLPLFDDASLAKLVRDIVPARLRLALERDEDVLVVRRKESILAALRAKGSDAMRWKEVLDLWCACWFWEDGPPPTPAVFNDLCDGVLRGRTSLPSRAAASWQERAHAIACARRFLHWELEFPEVFFDDEGRRRADAGFDAVIGNPPWDMVRGDSGEDTRRRERRADARQLLDFARGSGLYAVDARSHVNRYQLFVERALRLVRPGGRLGLVLPGGLASDAGSAPLRRHLFDRARVDTIVGLDNRNGIFPIHRSVRFVLLTATAGAATDRITTRFGVSDPDTRDDDREGGGGVSVSRAFLARVSGEDDLAIPELTTAMDLRIVEKITAAHAWLSSSDGWHVHFGRELNASDDRDALQPATGARDARPVLEGKQIAPFRVSLDGCTTELRPGTERTRHVPRRARLAYRDVASATNRLTLIAAIVPARAVTTHTLFCLHETLSHRRQLLLCALLNSFVANYLVRLRVHTHVTASIMARVPAPVIDEDEPRATRLIELATTLSAATDAVETMPEYVELQALVARLYGLSKEEFAHVVGRFPLIPAHIRDAAVAQFAGAHPHGHGDTAVCTC